ncbi:hypothetical protein SUDANB121_05929 (plasmid) [Nocardiopsis dassonvillei]|uniref:hypothetical protein n=1 Tax=Nocardiopsis dassonvillei TaxID=2014 RepID=UPI003F57397A
MGIPCGGTLMRPAREVALVRTAASLTGAALVPLRAELEHLTADDAATVARAIVTVARAEQRVDVVVAEARSW